MAKTNVWMSVSDLMTGLMVIFLFVSVAYMARANKMIKEQEFMFKQYVDTKNKLYEELNTTFQSQISSGNFNVNNDLSLRFSRAETLFENSRWTVSDGFRQTLRDVMPQYLNILLHDSLRPHIEEIRIEGHTDTSPFGVNDSDPYQSNMWLSQQRAREVLKAIREIAAEHFCDRDIKQIDNWLTAVGYSYTRALDHDGNLVMNSGKKIDMEKSKRVEIRIITDDYKVIKNILQQNANDSIQ